MIRKTAGFSVLAALILAITSGCTSYATAYKAYAEHSRTIIDCRADGGCPGLMLTLPGKIEAPYDGIVRGTVQVVGLGIAGAITSKAIDKINTTAAVAGAVTNNNTTTNTSTTDASTVTDDHSSRVDDNSSRVDDNSQTASTTTNTSNTTSSAVTGDTIQDSYNSASSVADSYNPTTTTDTSTTTTTTTDNSTQTQTTQDDHSVDDHSYSTGP